MNEWMNHPAMKTIDPVKLELIKTAAAQTSGKKGNSLATVMMALIASANKKGIQFTSEEISLILEILKEGKTTEEKLQIDNMVRMVTIYEKEMRKEIKILPLSAFSASLFVSQPSPTLLFPHL